MDGTSGPAGDPRRILTLPNLISLARILLIPAFVVLIIDPDTTTVGLIVFASVIATDWVDGTVARRTGQVSDLGKVLDPVADRLAIAAGLIALVVRGVFPPWAAVLILIRDAAVLIGGAAAITRRHVRVEVRFVGKLATFTLMIAIPSIAWSELGLPLAPAAAVLGWAAFAVGIVEYYLAAGVYARDIRRATARAR